VRVVKGSSRRYAALAMFERFRRDLQRLFDLDGPGGETTVTEKLRVIFHSPQIQAIAVYRFGRWINENVRPRALKLPLKVLYHSLDKTTHALWGIHIDEGADIGGGFYIGHPGDLIIGPVKMGVDCNVSSNTLIGRRTDGHGAGVPSIGDRVWIGAGSIVFGNIVIGSGSTVGPLTVVGRNIPPRTLVVGNPMQVMKRDYDNTAQVYGTAGAPDASTPGASMSKAAASAKEPS
jgi:serine O-acetyltransferase